MTGMVPKRQRDGKWLYPPIGAALELVVLEEIGVYITRRQNTSAQYIATLPIIDLCMLAEWKPELRLSRQWWEQTVPDILGIRAWDVAAEGGGGKEV